MLAFILLPVDMSKLELKTNSTWSLHVKRYHEAQWEAPTEDFVLNYEGN